MRIAAHLDSCKRVWLFRPALCHARSLGNPRSLDNSKSTPRLGASPTQILDETIDREQQFATIVPASFALLPCNSLPRNIEDHHTNPNMSMYNHRGLGPAQGNTRLNELLENIRAEFENQARVSGEVEQSSESHTVATACATGSGYLGGRASC